MSDVTILTSFGDPPDVSDGVYRAGGTDLQERLRTSGATPHIYDLTGVDGFAGIGSSAGGTTIGAGTTVAAVADELADTHRALSLTAGSLATPQIRAVATIGGNLAQRTRCWYFRHPHLTCYKSGGDACPARTGRHMYGVAFDTSPCVHPHPSSIAAALLTYDATVTLASGDTWTVAELYGDGSDPSRDNLLPDGEIIASITVPPAVPGERGAYFRSISRFEAEWPLVEAVGRLVRDRSGAVTQCGIGLGGVAPVPLRMSAAERILIGSRLDDETIAAAAAACTEGASPLPETGYKVQLIEATVREVLERLAA